MPYSRSKLPEDGLILQPGSFEEANKINEL
jgi:hypothetical protein